MTCCHDAMFRRENESNGGIGCPIFNSIGEPAREHLLPPPLVTGEQPEDGEYQ